MKISVKVVAAAAAFACSVLPGCNSLKRAGTDVAVVVTSPATVVLNGVHDALDWGPDSDGATPIVLAPLNIPLHMIKHVAYTIVYAGDLIISPFYLLANITPRNRDDLEPISLYDLSEGYPWKNAPWPEFED